MITHLSHGNLSNKPSSVSNVLFVGCYCHRAGVNLLGLRANNERATLHAIPLSLSLSLSHPRFPSSPRCGRAGKVKIMSGLMHFISFPDKHQLTNSLELALCTPSPNFYTFSDLSKRTLLQYCQHRSFHTVKAPLTRPLCCFLPN